MTAPYLSVVVTSRNDDHGGNPLARFQAFIDTFDEQCRRTGLDAEVVVVEWNPPPDRPRLFEALRLPEPHACDYRFVEVPEALHRTLAHADALPLFQMIGKNVGIRRARGQFVLATNIDILISSELVEFLAKKQLESDCLYRVDRFDVDSQIPFGEPVERIMDFCRSHQLRVNRRWGTYPVEADGRLMMLPNDIADPAEISLFDGWHVLESDVDGVFRWATPLSCFLVNAPAEPRDAEFTVLELETEANPYDRTAWADVEIVDGGRGAAVIGRIHVEARTRHRVLLPVGTNRIVLRVKQAFPPDGPRTYALFERRDGLAYVVRSISVRRQSHGLLAEPHEYASDAWASATETALSREADAVTVSAPAGGYALKYGPLAAPVAGDYTFAVDYSAPAADVLLGALAGDEQSWLPSQPAIISGIDRSVRRTTLTLQRGQTFWLMLSTAAASSKAPVTVTVRSLTGSLPAAVPASAVAATPAAAAAEPPPPDLTREAGRIGQSAVSVITKMIDVLPAAASRVVDEARHGIVMDAPEYLQLRAESDAQRVQLAEAVSLRQQLESQVAELQPLTQILEVYKLFRREPPPDLHLNACGDFQLMARTNWLALRGYPEIQAYSMSIDGMFGTIAFYAGIRERALGSPLRIYHLEHAGGSGWTPEGEGRLRSRLQASGIPWVEASTVSVLASYMSQLGRAFLLNPEQWGFGDRELVETSVPGAGRR